MLKDECDRILDRFLPDLFFFPAATARQVVM